VELSSLEGLPSELNNSSFKISHKKLGYEVVSCAQAAKSKKIPEANELKTLILWTCGGFVAVHICGDRLANLKEIKNFLKCKQASLASPEQLLAPGKICPLLNPTWAMKHLISKQVLNLKKVSTNDGTREGYIVFNPRILLLADNYKTGLFSKTKS